MTAVTISRWQRTAWQARRLMTAYNTKLSLIQKYLTLFAVATVAVGSWLVVSSWSSFFQETYHGQSLALNEYRLVSPPVELQLMRSNASGIAYNPDTDTLFAVANNPPYLVEMDKQGRELRTITLEDFHDTEGLVYVGRGRFAITEESKRSVVVVEIGPETQSLKRSQGRSVSLPAAPVRNKGFEGVAFSSRDQSLFVVNEDQPRELYRIDGVIDPAALNFSLSTPWSMEKNSLDNTDLSGLHFDARTGHLLVLSDESKALTEATLKGQFVSRLTLSGSKAGFERDVPQPEGVTMDNDGMLYILSEPNLLYRLAPPKAAVAAQKLDISVSAEDSQAKSR